MTTETTAPPARSATPGKTGAGATLRIRRLWERLSPLPGGKWLFSKLLGQTAPYTGTMGARVEELRPGYARASLRDRRKVRNHLRSVHAIALLNLAEMVSGLAAIVSMDPSLRGIITHLEMDYLKKARGTITAECETEVLGPGESGTKELTVKLTDERGEVVARALARWLLSD